MANELLDRLRRMSPNQKFLAGGTTLLVVAGVITLLFWVNSIRYSVLYADIPADEAGEIIDQLETMKVSYRLSDGGSRILVSAGEVHETRMKLAAAGMPRGGSVGFEIFDDAKLGMTDFLQKLNFRRALEGELARTIAGIREVSAARVHIVVPEQRLFAKDQQQPSASVVVKTGGSLSSKKLTGITHLVASAVEGLDADRVSVLDDNGNLLTTPSSDGEMAAAGQTLDMQQAVESHLQSKAQTLLDGVLGPGMAIVRINARLDFEAAERTIEQYDPDNTAIVSQETHTERTQENATTAEGGTGGSTTSENTVTNYEINRTVAHIIDEVGSIERLTVSVIVDGTYNTPADAPADAEPLFEPRTPEELTKISGLVQNAVGLETERGDQIEVTSVAFNKTHVAREQQMLDEIAQREFYFDLAKKVGYVVLAVLGFLFVRRMLKKTFRFIVNLVPPPPPAPPTPKVPDIEDEPAPDIQPEMRKPKLTDQMVKVAEERPDEVAKVIKTIMMTGQE